MSFIWKDVYPLNDRVTPSHFLFPLLGPGNLPRHENKPDFHSGPVICHTSSMSRCRCYRNCLNLKPLLIISICCNFATLTSSLIPCSVFLLLHCLDDPLYGFVSASLMQGGSVPPQYSNNKRLFYSILF